MHSALKTLFGLGFIAFSACPLLMGWGYAILARRLSRTCTFAETVRLIWKSRGYRTLDFQAGRLIYAGATIGGFGMLVVIATAFALPSCPR